VWFLKCCSAHRRHVEAWRFNKLMIEVDAQASWHLAPIHADSNWHATEQHNFTAMAPKKRKTAAPGADTQSIVNPDHIAVLNKRMDEIDTAGGEFLSWVCVGPGLCFNTVGTQLSNAQSRNNF
jgi:hypothetical protein